MIHNFNEPDFTIISSAHQFLTDIKNQTKLFFKNFSGKNIRTFFRNFFLTKKITRP